MNESAGMSQTYDPVCGLRLEPGLAGGGACMHEGRVHYFCSHRCRGRFLLDPDAYGKPAWLGLGSFAVDD
jgi:Cu+-exporting ATPase